MFVVIGAVILLVGVLVIGGLALAHLDFPGGRGGVTLLTTVPVGIMVIVFGLVFVIRGKPVTDDGGAQRADFLRRNREALRQQKEQRQREKDERRQQKNARRSPQN
ncbi:hypothetical protein B7R25_10565 [Subtercola boreus]|uniref:Uncharacterized protein n=1 Tax=Subtercola boreus TaxID=120213 RepID=A0A3E0WAY1_9MICO|nr:hypothetical protein B7R25_10565 [Subtercola boreus]